MARADFKTWLSLDEWGIIMGVNPLHLNQMNSDTLFRNNNCGGPWFQSAFQHADRIGRDDLAMAIQAAEQEISAEVGFNLMPDWEIAERVAYPKPNKPGLFGAWGTNANGQWKTVEALRGEVISGGFRSKSLIQAGAAIVRTDVDGDQYQETCTVIIATTVTNESEIHLYYPAQDGNDAWEIRPIKVFISNGNALINFKAWQVAAANQQDALDPEPLDADDANSYETTVDVYRVYNDPSVQVQFMWEGGADLNTGCGSCNACEFGTQYGCMHFRDTRLGLMALSPGDWDAATLTFSHNVWSACREPDQVRLWYYSGDTDPKIRRPYAEMSNYWKYAVAYYAAGKLDRPVSGCSNVVEFINKWRLDASFSSMEQGGFTKTADQMSNRLGTTAGALYAYQRIRQNGIAVNK